MGPIDRELDSDELLDAPEVGPFGGVAERYGDAVRAGPGGSADPVNIGLRLVR